MPLVASVIQKKMETAITSALKKAFAKEGSADVKSHAKMAAAIAEGVTKVIVNAILTDAEVVAGIPTAGSPAAQATTAPGKIM